MASAKQLAARRKFARIMKSGGFKKKSKRTTTKAKRKTTTKRRITKTIKRRRTTRKNYAFKNTKNKKKRTHVVQKV